MRGVSGVCETNVYVFGSMLSGRCGEFVDERIGFGLYQTWRNRGSV